MESKIKTAGLTKDVIVFLRVFPLLQRCVWNFFRARKTSKRINLQQGTYNINLYSTVDDNVADWIQNVAKLQIEPFDYYHTGRDIPANQGQFIIDYSIQ